MIETLIVCCAIGIMVVIIIILNWREKADREINVFTSLPFEKDKHIKKE